jgi:hypothetical protein
MSTISSLSAYVKLHERLIGLVLAAAVIWGVSGKIESVVAKHDKSQETQAQIVANAQQSKDAALATQAAQQAEQYKELSDKVAAQNDALVTALVKQQHTDASLPPSDLIARWNTLVPQAGATVTSTGVALPEAGAVATVQQLESVPVLTQQLANTNSLLGASQKQVVTLDQEVSGLNLQLVDNQKVCTEELKVQADQYKKSRWHWFWAGMAAGFLGRSALIK